MSILGSLRQWWFDQEAERAFYALSSEEPETLARDNGFSEGDLERILVRGSRGGQELPCLLQALTLDPAVIERRRPTLMRDMSITCSTCDAVKQCRRGLATDLRHAPSSSTARTRRRLTCWSGNAGSEGTS